MSSSSSGMACSWAWTSGRDPLRPDRSPAAAEAEARSGPAPSRRRRGSAPPLRAARCGGARSARCRSGGCWSGVTSASVVKSNAAPRRPAIAARTSPAAVDQPRVGGQPRQTDAAHLEAARVDHARRRVVRPSARMIVPSSAPGAHRESAGEARHCGAQMRLDPLRAARRREGERPVERRRRQSPACR